MKTTLSAALVLLGTLGAASAALAATPVARHPDHPAGAAKAAPVAVMSEVPDAHPGIAGVFQASDGVIYTPSTNDPRTHGLPNF